MDFFVEEKGNNTGLYCSMCGKWQKWLNKDELRVFQNSHKPKRKNNNDDTTRLIETNDYVTTAYGSLHYYKCEKCGHDEMLDNDNFCSHCGRKIVT